MKKGEETEERRRLQVRRGTKRRMGGKAGGNEGGRGEKDAGSRGDREQEAGACFKAEGTCKKSVIE